MSQLSSEETQSPWVQCLQNLQEIRSAQLEPTQFWPRYLEALRGACRAEVGMVAVRGPEEEAAWQAVAYAPAAYRSHELARSLAAKLDPAAVACREESSVLLDEDAGAQWGAVRLLIGTEAQLCLALFYFGAMEPSKALEGVRLLRLLNDVPAHYQLSRAQIDEIERSRQLAAVLDLMAQLNGQERFLAAAMTFCNELASRHQCQRVSLGWYKDGYMRVQAISHVDDFEKKMDAVQKLELAMEEAFDQDAEVVLPAPDDDKLIARDHEAFAQIQQSPHVCSVPLRLDGAPVGVCTFERQEAPFAAGDVGLLRLYCDQAVRRLADLKGRDRWFGARLAAYGRDKLAGLLGYRHTWAKALTIVIGGLLAFMCFVPVTYRLDAPAMLRTDDVAFLTAPFDGYIERVAVRVGDAVEPGDTLLALDQSDLLLEEAELIAERNRYQREFEKARADQALANMRIAEALRQQAAARLDLVRHRLGQAVLTATHAGIVVEGDQIERVGSPVSKGDVLFRVGQTDRLYAELEVPETEIHHVDTALDGEVALASRPQEAFAFDVTRVEPSAVPKEEGNAFIVRGEFSEETPAWWKPGMTGVAKVNAGDRTLLWIFTHRTVDFLRLYLWW